MIPAWNTQMEGKGKGDKFKAVIAPERGYGEVNKDLLQKVPLDNFGGQKVEEGMQFQAGEHSVVTVRGR